MRWLKHMMSPFPWRMWLKLNAACLLGAIALGVMFSAGQGVITALFTLVPMNILIVVQWTRQRIHGDVQAKWKASTSKRITVAAVFLVALLAAFCSYYLYEGESPGRVLVVGIFGLWLIAGIMWRVVWLRQHDGPKGTRHPDPPEMM